MMRDRLLEPERRELTVLLRAVHSLQRPSHTFTCVLASEKTSPRFKRLSRRWVKVSTDGGPSHPLESGLLVVQLDSDGRPLRTSFALSSGLTSILTWFDVNVVPICVGLRPSSRIRGRDQSSKGSESILLRRAPEPMARVPLAVHCSSHMD